MGVVEEVKTVLNQDIERKDKTLDEALQLYHEFVRKRIITPRGNQLVKDEIAYKKGSNFL